MYASGIGNGSEPLSARTYFRQVHREKKVRYAKIAAECFCRIHPRAKGGGAVLGRLGGEGGVSGGGRRGKGRGGGSAFCRAV